MADSFRTAVAKLAVKAYRNRGALTAQTSARTIARDYGITVPDLHESAGCVEARRCTGGGCRL